MNRKVTITCTEEQLALLETVCDRYSRIMCGQLRPSFQDICEEAWERDHKTAEFPFGISSPEWFEMRSELESRLKDIEWSNWGLSGGRYYGVGYNETADNIWDMYQVMRHARYLNMSPEGKESMRFTVMADEPMRYGEMPLISVEYNKKSE